MAKTLPDQPASSGPPHEQAPIIAERDALAKVAARYAVAITPHLMAAIDPDEAADPIAAQFLPDPSELAVAADERGDPIGDTVHEAVPGLIHRYRDRVLLHPSLRCAVYCRFCFRRETVGPRAPRRSDAEIDAMLGYIAAHPEIWEVILSGGDPLALPPRFLGDLLRRLAAIPHVAVIRLHSRVPVAAPARIDADVLAAMTLSDATLWLGLHCNHARELTEEARAALARIAGAGIPMVSQSVLLAGINDNAAALSDLFRALVECRVKPYYLHHLDRAPGTARFRVPLDRGRALHAGLRGDLSGLCQPHYMLDLPGGAGKVPVAESSIAPCADGGWRACDRHGRTHSLPPDY